MYYCEVIFHDKNDVGRRPDAFLREFGDVRGHGHVLGELSFGLVVVHAVAGDGGQLPAPVVLVVDVVGDVLQVLHVGPGRKDRWVMTSHHRSRLFGGGFVMTPNRHKTSVFVVPDQHVPQNGEIAVIPVLNCRGKKPNKKNHK